MILMVTNALSHRTILLSLLTVIRSSSVSVVQLKWLLDSISYYKLVINEVISTIIISSSADCNLLMTI